MKDSDVIKRLRKMDTLLEKLRKLNLEIEDGDHPNAANIAYNLDIQCVPLAWLTHVGHNDLRHPERYEAGTWGIRRKKKDSNE